MDYPPIALYNLAVRCVHSFREEPRRRQDVAFDGVLRRETGDAAKRFHELVESEITPKPVYSKKCDNCSMYDLCMPKTVEKA
ncbi:MAG: Dna2/Cas4 domain-containing protein, partial [Desulfobulbaceae bacterium]|nr:Dna2/Cas4 domain-containing protein [Desulfobulbaceae bacterium]